MIAVPGRHRIRLSTHAADVANGLAATGWQVALLDGRRGATKPALLRELQRQLDLPAWFGHNWDAVVDVLRERSGDGVALVVDRAEHLGASARVLGEIVDELAAEGHDVALYLRARRPPWRPAPPHEPAP